MLLWLQQNLATVIISALVIAAVVLIIVKMVRDKKNGKSSCSCGCANCAMQGNCHAENKPSAHTK